MLRPQHYRKVKGVKSQRRHWVGCVEETLLSFWRQIFGEEGLHWRSLWFKAVPNQTNAPPWPLPPLLEAISRCNQNRSHTYFLPFFPTSDYFQLRDFLYLRRDFSLMNAQSALGPMWVFCIPQSPWVRSSQVLEHAEPHPSSLTNVLWCLLVLTVSSENFPFSRCPEITPGTAYLHILLIWGEIRLSWIVTRNFSHLFLVRWAFLSKKLTHAKTMQGTLLLHKVLKEFLSALIHLPDIVLQIVVQLEYYEQISWILLLPANQGRN